MGALTRLRLPRLGETMDEARVVEWLKPEGAAFRRGEVLLEVETDKTVVEVPALRDGVLLRHLVQPGDTVELDAEIAEIKGAAEAEGGAETGPRAGDEERSTDPAPAIPPGAPASQPSPRARPPASGTTEPGSRVPASPAARRLAQRNGLDLAGLQGSGPRGRVQTPDVAALLDRACAPDTGLRMVETTAGPVACRQAGTGAVTAVLLHGLFADGLAWRDLPAKLAAQDIAALAIDLPGHGATRARMGDLDAVTNCLAEVLDQLAPAGRCVLLGHSFGAIAAARLAQRLGERAAGLILSAPAGIGLGLDARFVSAMLEAETPQILAHALEYLGPEAGPVSDTALTAELARLRAGREGHARAAALAVHNGVQTADIRPLLASCAPVPHVLVGMRDRVLDWRDALHLPSRVALHFCAEAGHMPHLAVPRLVQELVAAAAR